MRRKRNARIVATLRPSSSDLTTVRALFDAGADVFRLNLSHGTAPRHQERLEIIRGLERDTGRPIDVSLDLQGPKLRLEFRTQEITAYGRSSNAMHPSRCALRPATFANRQSTRMKVVVYDGSSPRTGEGRDSSSLTSLACCCAVSPRVALTC